MKSVQKGMGQRSVVSVGKVECFNCGGGHVARDQKCLVRLRQVDVSRVQLVQKVSYVICVPGTHADSLV
jgi:hypothetical protein